MSGKHDAVQQGDDAVWLHHTELSPWADNPNVHPQFQPETVAESIRAFGFVAPAVVWRKEGRLVAGHGRLQAMNLLCDTGYDYIDEKGEIQHREADPSFAPQGAPKAGYMRVIFHDFPSETAANAYAVADNELARQAHMDEDQVKKLLRDVRADDSFGALHAIGFPADQLQAMLSEPDDGTDFLDAFTGDGKEETEEKAKEGTEGGDRRETLVDFVVPMSVAERAELHGIVNLSKRKTGVTSTREAVLLIFKSYEDFATQAQE